MSDANDPVASFTAHPRTFMRTNIIVVGGITAEQVTGQIFTTPQEIYMLGQSPKLRLGLVELNGEQIDNKPGGKVYGLLRLLIAQPEGISRPSSAPISRTRRSSFSFQAARASCSLRRWMAAHSVSAASPAAAVQMSATSTSARSPWIGGRNKDRGGRLALELNVVDDRLGANSLKIQPPDYRGPQGDTCSTTVGRLGSDGMWHFYTLRYRKSGARRHYHVGLVGEGV